MSFRLRYAILNIVLKSTNANCTDVNIHEINKVVKLIIDDPLFHSELTEIFVILYRNTEAGFDNIFDI